MDSLLYPPKLWRLSPLSAVVCIKLLTQAAKLGYLWIRPLGPVQDAEAAEPLTGKDRPYVWTTDSMKQRADRECQR